MVTAYRTNDEIDRFFRRETELIKTRKPVARTLIEARKAPPRYLYVAGPRVNWAPGGTATLLGRYFVSAQGKGGPNNGSQLQILASSLLWGDGSGAGLIQSDN